MMTPSRLCLLLPLMASWACGDTNPPVWGAGGSSSSGGATPLGGSATAAAGSTSSSDSGTGGLLSGASGAGGSPAGAGGSPAGAGGLTGTGGLAGGTSAGGGGGASSAGSGGAAGQGGGSLLSIAHELDKVRLECPCIDPDHFGLDKSDNCDATPAVDRQTHVKKLGGDPNVVYDVKLRVRGNTEPNTYQGGKLEQGRFYIGGQTSTPGYTAYMLTVAQPPQVYFFNYNASTGHIHFLIDYEVVIPMQGGTTATFEVNGGKSVPDGHGVSNRERLVVPGVAPAPDPFNGQLVQFDVVSVQLRD